MAESTRASVPAPRGILSNEDWDALLAHVDQLVREIEALPDPRVRERVLALLQGIDALHREALHRLVRLFKDGVLEKVVTDPAIHTLMELYDLLPTSSEAAQRGEQASGRLADIPVRVEPAPGRPEAYVPAHWVPALEPADDPSVGQARLRRIDDRDVLLCCVDGEWYALAARCTLDGASLDGARLTRHTLLCPKHTGCYYDVRHGHRIGGGAPLECFPVRCDSRGRVSVGFGIPFVPRLPSS